MEVLRKIMTYVGLRKSDPNAPETFNLKMMHGINKISIFMFLGCIIILIVRYVIRS
ncbi:MAG: DUF6728 family protein [Bacteroidota bacterium]